MSHDTSKQSVLFEGLSKKAVIARFDQDHASSDGGAVLLKACDEKLKLSAALAACLSDERQRSKVTHTLTELFQQRLFGIACGYADGNDAARHPVRRRLAPHCTLSRRRCDLIRLSRLVCGTDLSVWAGACLKSAAKRCYWPKCRRTSKKTRVPALTHRVSSKNPFVLYAFDLYNRPS